MNAASDTVQSSRIGTHDAIAAALAAGGSPVERVGRATWRLALDTATTVAHAQVEGEWFVLSAVAPGPHERIWGSQKRLDALLVRNSRLPRDIKHTLAGDELTVSLRGEVLLDEDNAREAASSDPVAGLVQRFSAASQAARAGAAHTGSVPEPEELESLCVAAGWQCVTRTTGEVDVTLEDPRAYRCAAVSGTASGVRLSVPLSVDPQMSGSGVRGHALALFLLRATGALRLARAALEPHANALLPVFEVLLAARPRALDIEHGLAALSVACERFGREAEALAQDPELAAAYLSVAGVQADVTHTTNNPAPQD